ncbi:MAG: ATP-binding protein [Candidatus Heimdallarchaeaceae archaeon]
MSVRKFDLNIEKILEDWEIYHAIREIIANSIDEQLLTKTKSIEIFKDESGKWHIRDYGRGLKYEHLTQNENDEKLSNPNTIGKFGIGLKDALATFDRHNVKVFIRSKFGDITLKQSQKHGFNDVITLHAYIKPPSIPDFVGTEFILDGVTDEDIGKAKDLFLIFSGERVIEKIRYGEVLEKKSKVARIYINGVKVAEEENFLFSYNITSLTKKIKQALNRERTNVGRNAYSQRVKSLLLSCKSKEVAEQLINDLENFYTGEIHDELKWIDVQEHAVKILNAQDKVVFITPDDMMSSKDMIDEAKYSGHRLVIIPENLELRIRGQKDISGNTIMDLKEFYCEYNNSFEFKFVGEDQLTKKEKGVYSLTNKIFSLIGGKPMFIKQIKISETMRKEIDSFMEVNGLWIPDTETIIIKRSQLRSIKEYAGTLLHETAHAISSASDVTREFEQELTSLLGKVIEQVFGEDIK